MKRILLIFGLFLTGSVYAQNYTRDAGIRLGDHFIATGRMHMDDENALELMLFLGRGGVTVTILKEFFVPALNHLSDNLYFQYGFGAHLGFRNMDHYQVLTRTYELDEKTFTPLLGLDGLVGIEYRFPEFPVLIGFDIKPYFEYSTTQFFTLYLQSVGFSLKYRF
jgi:hypothetical protein